MALTMAAVAANKGMTLGRLAVSVESRTKIADRSAATHFSCRVELDEGLTARERRILFNSARLCEVHKMLQGKITLE